VYKNTVLKKQKIVVISLVILSFAFIFYYVQWRPSEIRKNCEFSIFSKETAAYRGPIAARQNNKYRQCLVKNGLQPESLFVNTE
jgi:hypothetical protein